jgi:hypothetical protein
LAEIAVDGLENYDKWVRKTPSIEEIDFVINELQVVSQDLNATREALVRTLDKVAGKTPVDKNSALRTCGGCSILNYTQF